MISLRLTDKEYRHLQRVCDRRGIRTLSALARIALTELVQDGYSLSGGPSVRLTVMEKRLDKLETAVRRLRRSTQPN